MPPSLISLCVVCMLPHQPILRAGGLGALLCFLDFFPTSIQRTALRAVANLCGTSSSASQRRCPSAGPGAPQLLMMMITTAEVEGPLLDAVPALTNLLNHADGKIVESATLALIRILQSINEASGR